MKLPLRPLAVVGLTLAGCSYAYPIEAVFINGKLHFRANEKLNGCLNDLNVVSETGEIMWSIHGEFRTSPCDDSFPVAYGVAPNGLQERVAAKPLKAGVRYTVDGYDGDSYYGAFQYRRAIIITNTPDLAR
jgi:hypothetical protein